MLKVNRAGHYIYMFEGLVKNNPELEYEIEAQIDRFMRNPKDTRLDNHALKREMEGKWAFSITDDIRIIYKPTGSNTVRFLAIGTHKSVY